MKKKEEESIATAYTVNTAEPSRRARRGKISEPENLFGATTEREHFNKVSRSNFTPIDAKSDLHIRVDLINFALARARKSSRYQIRLYSVLLYTVRRVTTNGDKREVNSSGNVNMPFSEIPQRETSADLEIRPNLSTISDLRAAARAATHVHAFRGYIFYTRFHARISFFISFVSGYL